MITYDFAAFKTALADVEARHHAGTLDEASFASAWRRAGAAVWPHVDMMEGLANFAVDPTWLDEAWARLPVDDVAALEATMLSVEASIVALDFNPGQERAPDGKFGHGNGAPTAGAATARYAPVAIGGHSARWTDATAP